MADNFTGMQYGTGGVNQYPNIPSKDGYSNAPYTESVKVDGGISGYTPNTHSVTAAGNMLPQLQDYYFQRHTHRGKGGYLFPSVCYCRESC